MRFIFSVLALVYLASCSKEPNSPTTDYTQQLIRLDGIAMTIPYHIEVVRFDKKTEKESVQSVVDAVFDEVNRVYNKWNPQSELSQLNALSAYEPKKISEKLASFLQRTQFFVEKSHYRFDPTIEPIQQLWKKALSNGKTPSAREIEALRPAIGWDKIILNGRVFMKKHDKTALDLGGIAKGYAVDLLVAALHKMGFKNVFVEWGGEVHAIGTHPEGRKWAVYIPNLEDLNPDHALAYVPLNNEAIATSGDYLQKWTVQENGKEVTYFHVFDPATLHPLVASNQSIASASCLAKDCMTADALATCLLMCPTLEEAQALSKEFQKAFPETSFWILAHH